MTDTTGIQRNRDLYSGLSGENTELIGSSIYDVNKAAGKVQKRATEKDALFTVAGKNYTLFFP